MNRDIFVDSLKARIQRLKGIRSNERYENTVKTDLFEEYIWDKISQNPEIEKLSEEFTDAYGYGHEAIHDVSQVFYQHDPQIRDKKAVVTGALKNLAVVKALATAPEFENLRHLTADDEYATAIAIERIGPTLHEFYQRKEEEPPPHNGQPGGEQGDGDPAPDDAQEGKSTPDPQGQHEDDGAGGEGSLDLDAMEEALDGMSEAELQALAEALAQEEAQVEADEQSRAEAELEADQDEAGLRNKMNKAIEQALEDLDSEEELFNSWGVSPGEVKNMDFETRRRYSELLRRGQIARFREMLGRFKAARKIAKKTKVLDKREEFYRIKLSDKISDLLPSEYAMMATPETEDDFWERYADKRLLTKQYRGSDALADGAIIVLVDNSDSMLGEREQWSKAFALALLESAREAKRDFIAINFSSRGYQDIYRFTRETTHDLDQAVTFITKFVGGGTDWEYPIETALEIIREEYNTEGKAKADVVLITDDECRVSQDFLRRVAETKEATGVRIYGVACAASTNAMSEFCDEVVKVGSFVDTDAVQQLLADI